MNIKNAFTFAELMISLVIIAIITVLLQDSISQLTPNNNAHLFKTTYKTIEMVVSDAVNTSTDGTIPVTSKKQLCEKFNDRLNVTSGNCSGTVAFIQTSNGVRWVFVNDGTIIVDVNASNNTVKNSIVDPENNCGNLLTGDLIDKKYLPDTFGPTGINISANSRTRDTFCVKVEDDGKISVLDSVGMKHLQGTTNN